MSPLPQCIWLLGRQNGNWPWWKPAYDVTWSFDHVVLQNHMTIKRHYISTIIVLMATKTETMINYLEELLSIKSHDPLITWYIGITWKTKIIISSLPHCIWPSNLASWWLPISEASTHNVTPFFDLAVLRHHVTNKNRHISTTTVLVATKLDLR